MEEAHDHRLWTVTTAEACQFAFIGQNCRVALAQNCRVALAPPTLQTGLLLRQLPAVEEYHNLSTGKGASFKLEKHPPVTSL